MLQHQFLGLRQKILPVRQTGSAWRRQRRSSGADRSDPPRFARFTAALATSADIPTEGWRKRPIDGWRKRERGPLRPRTQSRRPLVGVEVQVSPGAVMASDLREQRLDRRLADHAKHEVRRAPAIRDPV
jgi:hypothetical protein